MEVISRISMLASMARMALTAGHVLLADQSMIARQAETICVGNEAAMASPAMLAEQG
jgi:hypothetical protein